MIVIRNAHCFHFMALDCVCMVRIVQTAARPDTIIESEGIQAPTTTSINVVEGDTITLVCKTKRGGAGRNDFSWFSNDTSAAEDDTKRIMEGYDSRIRIFTNGSSESKLVIESAGFEHRAYYVCEVINELGLSTRIHLLVRVKGTTTIRTSVCKLAAERR